MHSVKERCARSCVSRAPQTTTYKKRRDEIRGQKRRDNERERERERARERRRGDRWRVAERGTSAPLIILILRHPDGPDTLIISIIIMSVSRIHFGKINWIFE